MVALAIVSIVPCAIAIPLDEYCISQVGQRKKLDSNWSADKLARVTIPIDGKLFHAIAASHNRLLLMRGEDETPIAQMHAPQDYGGIKNLILGKDGWLWIDGDQIDYTAQLNLDDTLPTIGSPIVFPELYVKPCSSFGRFFDNCVRITNFYYSATLDRTFVIGHRPTFLGRPNLAAFEMSAGKAKLLPAKASSARFVADIPMLNGVLLKGSSGKALFYDGVTVTNLLSDFPKRSARRRLPDWRMKSTLGGRTFLESVGSRSKGSPLLMELKAGPRLTPISVPKELENTWLDLFTLPNDPRLWGVTRNSILIEVKDSLRTVVTLPESYYIDIPNWQSVDGSIAFVVKNKTTDSSTDHFLKHASSTAECKVILNADEPISLDNE